MARGRTPGLVSLLLGLAACDPRPAPGAASVVPASPEAVAAPAPPRAEAAAAAERARAGEVPPLEAPAPFVELPVEGFAPAVVSVPRGARQRRPLVIATHGNYDRPEWQCEVWREIAGDKVFVLCPRGVARSDSPSAADVRFTYASNQALERELDAAMRALRARFPEHLDDRDPVYTGFSLGAIMGVAIATRAPGRYPRLVLVEGGHDRWTKEAAAAYVAGGGRRVMFVCAQAGCVSDARRAGARLEGAGAAVQLVRGPEVGHRYDGPVALVTRRALPWVLEGDERF